MLGVLRALGRTLLNIVVVIGLLIFVVSVFTPRPIPMQAPVNIGSTTPTQAPLAPNPSNNPDALHNVSCRVRYELGMEMNLSCLDWLLGSGGNR
jgi:hypothetical protein